MRGGEQRAERRSGPQVQRIPRNRASQRRSHPWRKRDSPGKTVEGINLSSGTWHRPPPPPHRPQPTAPLGRREPAPVAPALPCPGRSSAASQGRESGAERSGAEPPRSRSRLMPPPPRTRPGIPLSPFCYRPRFLPEMRGRGAAPAFSPWPHLPFQLHRSLEYCASAPPPSSSRSPRSSGRSPAVGALRMVPPPRPPAQGRTLRGSGAERCAQPPWARLHGGQRRAERNGAVTPCPTPRCAASARL